MKILLCIIALVVVVSISTFLNVWHANNLFHENRITRQERDEMVDHPLFGLCVIELVCWISLSAWLISVFT